MRGVRRAGQQAWLLGERTFICSPNSNLVLTAPLPFECETQASAEVPLLCLYVRLRRETIAELLASISPERMPPPVAGEKVLLSLPYRPQLTEEPFRATIAAAEAGAGPITVVASTAEPRART